MKFYFLFLLIFSPFISISQKILIVKSGSTDVPTGTDKEITSKGMNDIKPGESFYIEIKDFDPYLYNVELEYGDTTFTSAIDIPSLTTLNLSSLRDLVSIVSNGNIQEGQAIIANAQAPDPAAAPDPCHVSAKDILRDKKQYDDIISNQTTILDNIKNSVVEFILEAKLLDTDYTMPDKVFILSTQHTMKVIRASAVLAKTKFNGIATDLTKAETSLKSCEKAEANVEKKKKITEALTSIAKSKILITASLKAADELISVTSADKIEAHISPLINIINSKNKDYKSFPIQMLSNRIDLKINLVPRDTTMTLFSYSTRVSYPENSKNVIGIGSMFYYSPGSLEERISFVPTDSTGFKTVSEDDVKGEIGFSTAFTWGGKFTNKSSLGWHLFVGPGISVSKTPRIRALIGGGFSIGDNHNLILNYGAIFGYYDRISNAVTQTSRFETIPENNGIISNFNIYPFLSVGYLFNTTRR